MDDLKRKIHEENGSRWIGRVDYSCSTCSHSMSTENDELVCVVNSTYKKVNNEHLCKDWN